MKKLNEGGKWEKEWADAFEHASLQPSDNVWNAVDGNLANKEARKYKRRAAFFQWVAAASVFISMCGAAWLFTQSVDPNADSTLAEQQQEVQQPSTESKDKDFLIADQESGIEESGEQAGTTASGEKGAGNSLAETTIAKIKTEVLPEAGEKESSYAANPQVGISGKAAMAPYRRVGIGTSRSGKTKLAASNQLQANTAAENQVVAGIPVAGTPVAGIPTAEKVSFIFFEQSVASVEASFQKVWTASDLLPKKKEVASEKFWLGAVLASSSFDPNFQDNSTSLAHFAQNDSEPVKGGMLPTARVSQWNEEQQQQVSFNGGVQAAARIGKKWVLQGGLQYGSYRSSTTAGTYVDQNGGQAFPLHYANFSSDKVQMARLNSRLTAPVAALNTFEFISVPLQIGYVVFDKKLSLLVSPGISSEFFLRNQLSDLENRLSTYTIYSGEDAPFQTVHLKGIFGAQLFYKFSDNYMISLEPSFQHALTEFNKSSSFFESRPSNIGIAAGFRYIIR